MKRQNLLKDALEQYIEGKVSLGKAAELADV